MDDVAQIAKSLVFRAASGAPVGVLGLVDCGVTETVVPGTVVAVDGSADRDLGIDAIKAVLAASRSLMPMRWGDEIIAGKINAPLKLACDILRDIFRPVLSRVECDHADRVAVLARHQIGDDGFEIGLLDIGLGKRGAEVSEIIDDKINGLIVIGWHNRRGPAPTHGQYSIDAISEI